MLPKPFTYFLKIHNTILRVTTNEASKQQAIN